MNMSIRENIQQVRENIAAAALSAGRRPEDITLVGASKMNDAAACREAPTTAHLCTSSVISSATR